MYPEMAAEDLITLDELWGKLAHLRDNRATAEHEPEEVRGRAESATKPSQWKSATTSTARCTWSSLYTPRAA
jgi:hypothetical protein